jgi:hypothetical protein
VAVRNEGQKVKKDMLNRLAAKDSIRAIADFILKPERLTKAMKQATCASRKTLPLFVLVY